MKKIQKVCSRCGKTMNLGIHSQQQKYHKLCIKEEQKENAHSYYDEKGVLQVTFGKQKIANEWINKK